MVKEKEAGTKNLVQGERKIWFKRGRERKRELSSAKGERLESRARLESKKRKRVESFKRLRFLNLEIRAIRPRRTKAERR